MAATRCLFRRYNLYDADSVDFAPGSGRFDPAAVNHILPVISQHVFDARRVFLDCSQWHTRRRIRAGSPPLPDSKRCGGKQTSSRIETYSAPLGAQPLLHRCPGSEPGLPRQQHFRPLTRRWPLRERQRDRGRASHRRSLSSSPRRRFPALRLRMSHGRQCIRGRVAIHPSQDASALPQW